MMARKGMSWEAARNKFYREHELRQVPGDEQQIEYRRGPDADWTPYAFYDTVEEANAKFAEMLQIQESLK